MKSGKDPELSVFVRNPDKLEGMDMAWLSFRGCVTGRGCKKSNGWAEI